MTRCAFCDKESVAVVAIPDYPVTSQCKEHYDLTMKAVSDAIAKINKAK